MARNRFWRLDRNPEGSDFAAALSLQEEELPPLAHGEIRIRNRWLSMDAGTRMWMGPREDGYQPPLALGSKMSGQAIGRVVESRDPRYPEGTLVRGFGQWADHSTVVPDANWVVPLPDDVADERQHFGVLGLNGWTALYGVKDIIGVKPGDVLVVSAAAGATGLLACQIGRNLGATVVGIAGGPDKCRWLLENGIVDRAIDYKGEDVAAAIAGLASPPTAYFENVGGAILDAVMPHMALHGRIGVCGLIAAYERDEPLPGPRHFDQVLMKRLRIEGIFLPDVPERGPDYYAQLLAWLTEGRIMLPFDMTEGLDNTLTAYARMMTGKNIGKVLVSLGGDGA